MSDPYERDEEQARLEDMQENAAKIRAKLVGEIDRSDVQNLESECSQTEEEGQTSGPPAAG
jgi:hypothetical protein